MSVEMEFMSAVGEGRFVRAIGLGLRDGWCGVR